MVLEVAIGAEVHRVVGTNQHGVARQALELVGVEVDRRLPSPVENNGRPTGHSIEGKLGEVVSIGIPMERNVEVGAGVRTHRDQADLERDPRSIDLFGGLPSQVIRNHGRGQTRVGNKAIGDDVAQIDEHLVKVSQPSTWFCKHHGPAHEFCKRCTPASAI